MRLHNILLLSFLSLFVIAACNMFNEPAHNNPNGNITLNVEDASCTEAWIEVKFAGVEFPAELRFYINDSLAESLTAVKDTLLYIEGLQPSRTYRLKAKAVRPQETVAKSAEAEVTTMDTTSHDFTWQTFTFGGSGGSSWLNDVAIINENDIWAVGEINIADTTNPNGYTTYNAVHWNGQEWELKRIDGNGYPRNTVYAFNENDVWFDGFIKWDGYEYSVHTNNFPLEPNGDGWRVYGMWGTSSSDFYIVGEHGNIAHYDGTSWEKIESGTTSNIHEVWGIKKNNGRFNTYFAASNSMLVIDDNNSTTKINLEQNMILLSLWGKTNNLIYTAGNGAVIYKNEKWERIDGNYVDKIYEIKGRDYNDIYGIANGNVLMYYNGLSWKNINTNTDNKFWNLSVGRNIIVAVGFLFEKALITVLKK